MIDYKEQLISRMESLSLKYHKMSLLFYELSQSFKIELRNLPNSKKHVKNFLKEQDLDFDKIFALTKDMNNIKLSDLKKDERGLN